MCSRLNSEDRCREIGFRGRKRHINIWHINNLSVTPGHRSSRPGTRFLPAGYPDENVYVPWVPPAAHELLTPGHRSGDPPPTRSGDPPPGRAVTGKICLCLCAFSCPEDCRLWLKTCFVWFLAFLTYFSEERNRNIANRRASHEPLRARN